MGGNPFYSNAEAYAFEILQQKLIKEAQRSAQQTFMELSAFKSLFNQGQFVYCIPFGGFGFSNNAFPFPFCPAPPPVCPPEIAFRPPDPQPQPQPLPPPPPVQTQTPCNPPPTSPSPHPHPQVNQQSIVRVNVRNAQPKLAGVNPGSDECSLGESGIDVTIDLREYLPAEISLDVEEKTIEVKACHVDARGSKTFARKYDLPACIILDTVKCVLSHDGYLLISAAWVKME